MICCSCLRFEVRTAVLMKIQVFGMSVLPACKLLPTFQRTVNESRTAEGGRPHAPSKRRKMFHSVRGVHIPRDLNRP